MFARNLLGVERRYHPSNEPPNWLLYGTGATTYTGKNITEEDALTSTAFFAGVRILSETVASLPLHFYKRIQNGKDRATNHHLFGLLSLKPNSEMAAFNYRETMLGDLCRYGNHYSEKSYDNRNILKELWPLLPHKMEVLRGKDKKLWYRYTLPDGTQSFLPRERVLHIPGFSPNGITGYNPFNKTREAIALVLALEEYAARFFGSGGKPPIILTHPNKLSPEGKKNLKESWTESHGGLSNAHRVAVLEEGMEIKEYGVSPEDAQALESRKFSVTEVSRILNIPPHFLRDLENATYTNIEHQDLEFVKYSIRPWLVRLEQNYCLQLLTEKEQKKYFWEHIIDGLLRGDVQSRWEAYRKGFDMGVWSPDDIREMENKNPVEGGNQRFVPLNMIPLDKAGEIVQMPEGNPNEPPEGDETKSVRSLENRELRSITQIERIKRSYFNIFKNTFQTIVNKETLSVKRAAKKNLSERGVSGFQSWVEAFYTEYGDYVNQIAKPVLRSYQEMITEAAQTILGPELGTGDLEKFFDDCVEVFVKRYIGSSSGQLTKIVKEIPVEELLPSIIERMDEWFEKKAEKLARDETTRFANSTALETYRLQGATKKIWRTRGKNCPFCNSLEGKVIAIEEPFFKAGSVLYVRDNGDSSVYDPDTGKYSGSFKSEAENVQALKIYRTKLHAPIHQGCDCFIVPGK